MTHADAFLQAILDAPDDDAPRLLFADWLDERGDSDRAEFIRVQIALEKRGPRRSEMWSRQNRLLTLHEEEWSAPARGVASDWTFRRGFIDEVHALARPFLTGADDLFRQAPVCHVRLCWGRGAVLARTYVPLLISLPHLQRLAGLDLGDNSLGSVGLQALTACLGLTRLTTLRLTACQIGDRGVKALADSPLLSRLTCLDLRDNDIGASGVRALARAVEVHAAGGDPPRLRELLLRGNPIGLAGERAVLASPALSRAVDLLRPGRMHRGSPKK